MTAVTTAAPQPVTGRCPAVRPPAASRVDAQPWGDDGADDARRHLRVVDEPRARRSLRTLPTFALSVAFCFGIALAVVICQALLAQGQQRIDVVEAGVVAETARYHELRLQVAQLEDPARVVAAARALGMEPPPEVIYLTPADHSAGPAAPDAPTGAADGIEVHASTRPYLEGGG